jgi:hypothetical protein
MTVDSDSYGEMHRLPFRQSPLSDELTDRLLSGRLPAADAPRELRGLAALLETATTSPTLEETAHKATVVAAAVAAVEAAGPVHSAARAALTPTSRRRSMLSKLLTAKAAAVATIAALGLGTAAAAATGSLPMQHNSHATVGLTIAASGQSNGTNGTSNNTKGSHPNTKGAAYNDHALFGLCTAFMAQHSNTSSTVPSDKSKTFSALESRYGGLSGTFSECSKVIAAHNSAVNNKAGTTPDDNSANTPDTGNKPSNVGPPSSTPPVSTPNSGGTGTANTASGGNSSTGTSTADTASGGASAKGSANAGGH